MIEVVGSTFNSMRKSNVMVLAAMPSSTESVLKYAPLRRAQCGLSIQDPVLV
jgi:hypothetical protein